MSLSALSEANAFNPPLTNAELQRTQQSVTVDPSQAERDRANVVIIFAAVASVALICAYLFGAGNAVVNAVCGSASFIITVIATVYKANLPKAYTKTVGKSYADVRATMAQIEKEREAAEANAGRLCASLNDEPFTVPQWATLGEWSWSIEGNRVYLSDTTYVATLIGQNDHGALASVEVAVPLTQWQKYEDAAQFRAEALAIVGNELDALSRQLGIATPKPAEKRRY